MGKPSASTWEGKADEADAKHSNANEINFNLPTILEYKQLSDMGRSLIKLRSSGSLEKVLGFKCCRGVNGLSSSIRTGARSPTKPLKKSRRRQRDTPKGLPGVLAAIFGSSGRIRYC